MNWKERIYNQEKLNILLPWAQRRWILSLAILLAAAGLAFSVEETALLSISLPLGIAMAATGIINIMIFVRMRESLQGAYWLFADGFCTLLLSLFLFLSQTFEPTTFHFFFGAWELFSGVIKVTDSIELKRNQIHGWHWFTGVGCLEILSGMAALLKPVDDFFGLNRIVAFILFLQSMGYLFKIMIYPRLTASSLPEENEPKPTNQKTKENV